VNLSGNFGFGYSGGFGNDGLQSTHSAGFAGDANLSGFYYHPNFLSFAFRPYYDRFQSNAESQNLTRSTGLDSSLNLFGGSRFPGTISFGKDFSSNSEFRIAGVPAVLGDVSGQNFGLSWNALVPDWPQFHASFTQSSSTSSIDGLQGDNENKSRNVAIGATYQVAGFNLDGNISNFKTHFTTPGFLTPEPVTTEGGSTVYSATAQHRLPLRGSASLGWTHSNYQSDQSSNWSSNSYTATANVLPIQRLSLNQTVTYVTNLSVFLEPDFLGAGSLQRPRFNSDSDSLYLGTSATVRLLKGLSVSGHFNHRDQTFNGQDYSDSQFGGTLNYNYATPLLGLLYFGFGVVDTASKNGNDGAGIVANVGVNKRFGHWETSADFNYQQNIQTQIIIATTSSYSYGGAIRRRINRDTQWSISARQGRTGLVAQAGSGGTSESLSTSFSYKRYNLTGSYSQASGTAVLSSNGTLTSAPLGSLITNDFMYFNARSYSGSVGAVLLRRIALTAGYANVFSSTQQRVLGVSNAGQRYGTRVEYRLRKFSIIGGFSRNQQAISTVGGLPRVVNSYYVSLNRWFNVF
jgi:hypothetical protein